MAGFGSIGNVFKGLGDMASLGKRRKRSVGPPNVKPKRRRRRKLGKLTGTIPSGTVSGRVGSVSPKKTIAG